MKELSVEQMNFLKAEFGIEKINYSDKKSIEEIRLMCFDIETEEAIKYIDADDEHFIGERGDMAVSVIDDLYDICCPKEAGGNVG